MPLREGQNLGQGEGSKPNLPTNRSINSELKYEEPGGDLGGKESFTGREEHGAGRQLVCLEYSDTVEGAERRLERTDPGEPGGFPDVISRAKDPNQDFKQDIIWLPVENGLEGSRDCCSSFSICAWATELAGAPGYAPAKGL